MDEFGDEIVEVGPTGGFEEIPNFVPAYSHPILVHILLGHLFGYTPPHHGEPGQDPPKPGGPAVPVDGSSSLPAPAKGRIVWHHHGLGVADNQVL